MPLLRNLLIAIATTAAQADNDFERVWMVCEQPKSKAPSAGEKAAGMATLEPAKCTDQLSFQSLCCAGFAKEDFKHSGVLGLDSTNYLTTSSTQAEKVIKVCTQASNGMALMSQAKSDAATMPVECTKLDITQAQLAGESDGLQPGEIVLRERLLFFVGQQIPISNVPTCEEAVKTCPGGKTPTTVQPAWIAKKKESLLSLKKSTVAKKKSFLQGKMDMDATSSNFNDEEGERFGFGGMMTSGSFMMMSSGF